MVTLDLHTAGSFVTLPRRTKQADGQNTGAPLRPEPPVFGPGYTSSVIVGASSDRKVRRDMATGEMVLEQVNDDGVVRFEDIGLNVGKRSSETFTSE